MVAAADIEVDAAAVVAAAEVASAFRIAAAVAAEESSIRTSTVGSAGYKVPAAADAVDAVVGQQAFDCCCSYC